MSAPTIAVCGFGRCGTTMVMTMLDAAGVPPIPGHHPGTFELPVQMWAGVTPELAAGRSFKILDGWRFMKMPKLDYRFVWLDRDLEQQARSTIKFLRWSGLNLDALRPDAWHVADMMASYRRDRATVLAAMRKIGPVTVMEYERVIARPARAARTLAGVCDGLPFDRGAAIAAVHRRTAECRPDCRIEERLAATKWVEVDA